MDGLVSRTSCRRVPPHHSGGGVGPASVWGQGSAPISRWTRCGKSWRFAAVTRGGGSPSRAPCPRRAVHPRTTRTRRCFLSTPLHCVLLLSFVLPPPSPSPSPLAPASPPPPLRSPSPRTTTTPTLSKTQSRSSIRRRVEPRQIFAPLEFSPLPFPPYFSPFLPLFATPTNPLVSLAHSLFSLFLSLSLARSLDFLSVSLFLSLSRSLALVLSRLCLLSFAPTDERTPTRDRDHHEEPSTSTTKNDHCGREHRWSATLRGSTSSAVSSGSSAQHTATYQNGCSLSLSFLFFSSSSFLPSSFYFLLFSTPLRNLC